MQDRAHEVVWDEKKIEDIADVIKKAEEKGVEQLAPKYVA